MKPLYWRSVNNKDAGRPRLTHYNRGEWNETKWMRWVWNNGANQAMRGLWYISFTMKLIWSDRDANSWPQPLRYEAASHTILLLNCPYKAGWISFQTPYSQKKKKIVGYSRDLKLGPLWWQSDSYHQKFLPKGRSFTANSGTKAPVLSKCRSSIANTGTQGCVFSLSSIWTDLKRSEKIQEAPAWRWGEWIWLTGPSGLHRNSPQLLNISSIRVFDKITDPEIPITLRPQSDSQQIK